MDQIELLDGLLDAVQKIGFRDKSALDASLRRAEMIIRNIFGGGSHYLKDLGSLNFYPRFAPAKADYVASSWNGGIDSFKNLVTTMRDEIELFKQPASTEATAGKAKQLFTNRVFIVHGHDEAMKQSVARIIERLNLEAIILHEQPNQGKTIIEKFHTYSDVGFAIVLLSPDDMGYPRTASPDESKPRARQNVVFELGYFIGKIGRERVVALYRGEDQFEMPSDFSGVLYVPFDNAGRWQFDIIKELKALNYDVDANLLI